MKKTIAILLALMLCLTCLTAYAGSYSSTIKSIHSSFVSGNSSAKSAPQQITNGILHIVFLLNLL